MTSGGTSTPDTRSVRTAVGGLARRALPAIDERGARAAGATGRALLPRDPRVHARARRARRLLPEPRSRPLPALRVARPRRGHRRLRPRARGALAGALLVTYAGPARAAHGPVAGQLRRLARGGRERGPGRLLHLGRSVRSAPRLRVLEPGERRAGRATGPTALLGDRRCGHPRRPECGRSRVGCFGHDARCGALVGRSRPGRRGRALLASEAGGPPPELPRGRGAARRLHATAVRARARRAVPRGGRDLGRPRLRVQARAPGALGRPPAPHPPAGRLLRRPEPPRARVADRALDVGALALRRARRLHGRARRDPRRVGRDRARAGASVGACGAALRRGPAELVRADGVGAAALPARPGHAARHQADPRRRRQSQRGGGGGPRRPPADVSLAGGRLRPGPADCVSWPRPGWPSSCASGGRTGTSCRSRSSRCSPRARRSRSARKRRVPWESWSGSSTARRSATSSTRSIACRPWTSMPSPIVRIASRSTRRRRCASASPRCASCGRARPRVRRQRRAPPRGHRRRRAQPEAGALSRRSRPGWATPTRRCGEAPSAASACWARASRSPSCSKASRGPRTACSPERRSASTAGASSERSGITSWTQPRRSGSAARSPGSSPCSRRRTRCTPSCARRARKATPCSCSARSGP